VKGLKTTLTMAIAVGLLAGSAVGVAAQTEDGPAAVDGTISVEGEACTETDFGNECPVVIEASDQRLSGDGFVRNGDIGFDFDDGERFMLIVNQSVRVENADGAWSGGGPLYALPFTDSDEGAFGTDQPTWVLTGEGAYDGLTAVLRVDFGEEGTFGGVVFEGDLPPAPPLE
jgi:hypothetical protein